MVIRLRVTSVNSMSRCLISLGQKKALRSTEAFVHPSGEYPNICYEVCFSSNCRSKSPIFSFFQKSRHRLVQIVVNMKNLKKKFVCLLLFLIFVTVAVYGQYDWKLSKDKDVIRVYESEVKNSNLKSIKVECVLPGTYDKLMAILNDVSRHKEWVFHSKNSNILKRNSSKDFYYYTETSMPWPMSNRDAVVHLMMNRDSLNRFLKITATGVPNFIAEKSGKVRVPRSSVSWYVTMPSSTSISIVYTFEADPGGSMPAWLVNMFADKGPYESFKKLSTLLKG